MQILLLIVQDTVHDEKDTLVRFINNIFRYILYYERTNSWIDT